MSDALKLILSLSVSGSALALLLFTLKRAFRHRLPKAFQYYVWLVVLLRLALPVSFGFSAVDSIFRSMPGVRGGVIASAAPKMPYTEIYRPSRPIVIRPGEEFSFNKAVQAREESGAAFRQAADYWLLAWIVGSVIALGINISDYARFAVELKKAHRSALPEEERLLKRLQGGGISVRRNPLARTPLLMGFFRPVIVLPDKAYTHEQLMLVLSHELTHYRRLDIPLKWLSVLVCCAHWFNPLAYFIQREIDRACELSCDEAVIKALDAQGKQAYGDMLISAVSADRFYGALTTMFRDKTAIKERLVAIMNYKYKSGAIKAFSVAMLLLVMTIAAALGACVPPAEEEPATKAPPTPENAVPFTVTPQPAPNSGVQTGTTTVTPAPDSGVQGYTAEVKPSPESGVQAGTAMVTPTPGSDVLYAVTVQPTPGGDVLYAVTVQPTSGGVGHSGQEIVKTDEARSVSAQPNLEALRIVIGERLYVTKDSGSGDVRKLQTRLNELAGTHPSIPKIAVNGEYDEATKAAVIEAQRVFGLAEDGIVGPDTWFAIAPFDGAAVFLKKSGEIFSVALTPRFSESAAANENVARDGAWIMVVSQGGSAGAAQNANADAVVEAAISKLGAPYQRSASGPDAFDCVAFVNWCLKQSGSEAGFDDAEAWAESDYPTIGALEDVRGGDILCFNGHVGICIGGGQMIDASSSQGKVRVANLDTQYWQRNFICAKRVFA